MFSCAKNNNNNIIKKFINFLCPKNSAYVALDNDDDETVAVNSNDPLGDDDDGKIVVNSNDSVTIATCSSHDSSFFLATEEEDDFLDEIRKNNNVIPTEEEDGFIAVWLNQFDEIKKRKNNNGSHDDNNDNKNNITTIIITTTTATTTNDGEQELQNDDFFAVWLNQFEEVKKRKKNNARISVQCRVEEEDEAAASSNNKEDEIFDPTEDMIESVFGFFFGKKEEEPMGMKRFWKERFPKQYEGTTDAKKYGFEFRPLSFHRYNPKGWVGYDEASTNRDRALWDNLHWTEKNRDEQTRKTIPKKYLLGKRDAYNRIFLVLGILLHVSNTAWKIYTKTGWRMTQIMMTIKKTAATSAMKKTIGSLSRTLRLGSYSYKNKRRQWN